MRWDEEERLTESGQSAFGSKLREMRARRPSRGGFRKSAPLAVIEPIAYLISREYGRGGVEAGGDELKYGASRLIRDLNPQPLSADQFRAVQHDLRCELHRLDPSPVDIDQIDPLQISCVKCIWRVEKVPHHPPPRVADARVSRWR